MDLLCNLRGRLKFLEAFRAKGMNVPIYSYISVRMERCLGTYLGMGVWDRNMYIGFGVSKCLC